MTSVNDFHERSRREMFWEISYPYRVEVVKTKDFRKYLISHMENLK